MWCQHRAPKRPPLISPSPQAARTPRRRRPPPVQTRCALPACAPQVRSPGCEPEVMSATVKVQLRLGLLRRAVYMVRPGRLLLPLLGAGAAAALFGGTTAAVVLLVLLAFTGFGGGGEEKAEGAADELGSDAGSEVAEVSSVSEASSSLLRQLSDDEGEPPSPRETLATLAGAGGRGGWAGGGRRAAAERWHDPLLPDVAAGSSSLGGAGRVGLEETYGRKPAGRAQRPADSAMGSEPSTGSGLLAAAVRRRAGTAKPSSSQ